MSKISKNTTIIIVLLALCVAIAVIPLVTLGQSAAFGGRYDHRNRQQLYPLVHRSL